MKGNFGREQVELVLGMYTSDVLHALEGPPPDIKTAKLITVALVVGEDVVVGAAVVGAVVVGVVVVGAAVVGAVVGAAVVGAAVVGVAVVGAAVSEGAVVLVSCFITMSPRQHSKKFLEVLFI